MIKKIIIFLVLITFFTTFIAFSKSVNNNITEFFWTKPEIISTESTENAYRASLDIDNNNNIHIAWKDKTNYSNSGDDYDIFYKFKPKNGNWSITEVVSTESNGESICLSLAIDNNNNIHIAWKDKTNYSNSGDDSDIFYKFKPKNGNWSITEVVSTESDKDCNCPNLKIDNNNSLHIVWPDSSNYKNSGNDQDIFYKYKLNGGNWSITEVVSTESNEHSLVSSLAIYKNIIRIIWEDKTNYKNSGDDWDIFYKFKSKEGKWSNTEIISNESSENSLSPSFDVDDNGNIHIIWLDRTNFKKSGWDYDIFYKYKYQNKKWSNIEVVSNDSTSNSKWTYLIIKNNTVHIAWSDSTNLSNSGNDYDIFYKFKNKDFNWSNTILASINSSRDSSWPSFDLDSNGIIHMSWWDSNDNWTIYYNIGFIKNFEKEAPTPGFVFIIIIFALLFLIYWRK